MAIHVEVNTTTATDNVGKLADQLDRLATAADKFNDTKLGSGLAQEFASLRSTMNELRDAMAGANSVFVDMRKQASANSNANKMLESSLKGVRGAIEAQTASLKVQGAVLRATAKEQESLTKSQREAQAYLERQKTTQQKVSDELKKFDQIAKENNITGREHARIVELITQSHRGAGLEIEKVGERLRTQTSQWGKSNLELLKATSGWDLLSGRMQKAITYQQKTADAQKVLTGYLKEEMSALQKHEAAYEALIKVRQNGFLKGREQETLFLELKKNILTAIENEKKAQEGLNSARAKHTTQTKTGEDYAAAVRNLDKLRDSLHVLPRLATDTESYRKTVAALGAEQRKEFATLTQHAADMKKIGPLYQRSIPPIQKYTETVEAARRAHQRYLDTSGKMGIASNTMTQVIGKARLDFLKANTSSELLGKGILGLTGRFNVLNQVTAASRAAMIGAGQSFGIFEGRTIAVAASVYALAKAIRSSITTGMEFEYSMTKVGVLMSEISEVMSGGFSQNTAPIRALREEIIRLGADTQFTATEVASAAEILARSGQDAGFIYANLEHVLDLAAVAMTDMANAADITTAVMASFGDTGYALSDAVDVLAAASVKSKATIDDLGLSLQYIGPLAAQAGLDFKETASILGVLADVNIRGSKAGTAFRRMLISLAAPTERAKKAMEGLGIEWKNLDLSGGGLERFFVQLNQMGLSATDLQRTLREVFGVYAISATTALTQGADKIGEFNKALNQTQGFAARMRDELRNNLKMAVEELTSEWEALQITAFDTFGPRLREQIEALTRYLEDNQGAIADTISSTVNGLTTIVTTVAEYHKAILNLAKAYLVLKVSSTFIAGGIGLWRKGKEAMDAYRASVAATAIATKAANTSTLGLGMGAGAAVKQVSRLGTAASFVGGILGGWVGAIALVVTGLAMWATRTKETTDRIIEMSTALQQVENFADSLGQLSEERVGRLFKNLAADIALIPLQIQQAEDQLKSLVKQLKATDDGIFQAQRSVQMLTAQGDLIGAENIAKEIPRLMAQRIGLLAQIAQKEEEILSIKEKEAPLLKAQQKLFEETSQQQIDSLTKVQTILQGTAIETWATQWLSVAASMLHVNNEAVKLRTYLGNFELASDMDGLKMQLVEVDRWITTLATNSAVAGAAVRFLNRPLEELQDHLKLIRESIQEGIFQKESEGAAEFKAEVAKAANELKAYFDAYEKAKGPVYAVNRELAEVDRWVGEIAAKTPRATAAMKEAGIGMEDAMAALDFAKSDLSMGFLEAAIGGVDSRFKDLRKTLAEVEDQELSLEGATQLLWDSLNDPKNAEVTKALGGAAEAFNRLFPLIDKTLDSSAALTKEWEKLSKEAAEFEVSITGNSDSLEDLVKRYSAIPGVTEDAARSTIALVSAKELLGDALKKTRDETETLAMAQWSLNELVADGTITTERATKAYNQLWASQPIGKLKAETIQRQAQIALIGQGAREQAIYNAAVSEFGANWMTADQAFKDAAGSLYDVNYELERATELHDTYMEFGDGVIGIFADMASGMETSFSNAADSLRDLMKKLLRDLIFMALRNKIMVGLGLEGSGSGSGQSSVWGWAQNLMSFFGGGKNAPSGGGSTTGGNLFNGTGMWNLNTAQNLMQGNWGGVANSIFGTGSGSASAASQAAGSGNSFLSSIFSASNWVKAGKSIWTGLFGSAGAAAGSAALGLGGGAAGMGVLSGMGAGTQIASAASYGAYLGPGSSMTYGVMQGTGYGVAAGAGGTAGSASIWATMGKALSSVPVVGWVIAAVLANVMASKAGYNALGGKLTLPNGKEIFGGGLDDIGDALGGFGAFSPALRMGGMAAQFANRVLSSLGLSDRMASIISGGALMTKLFGRREPRVTQATTALSVGPGGSSAMDIFDIYEKGGWFSSSKRYQVEFEATEEVLRAAQEMFNTLSEIMTQAAGALRSDTAEMIDATLSIVNEYEKDGKTIKATKYLVEMFGRTWEHATQDEAFSRLMSEATIAAIDKALGTTAQAIDNGSIGPGAGGLLPGLGDMGFRPDLLPIDTIVKAGEAAAAMVGEAHAIAERWREDVELLADGAAFLMAAATDMRNGFNLLNDGTLTQITDLVEDMRLSGEGLADAYARLVSSTKLLEQAFELAGATSDKTREEFVRFSADVVQAMGGLDEATQKWGAFFDSFYSAGELAQLRNEQLLSEGQRIFDGLDLNFADFMTETGLADFRQLYEEALPTLSPAQVAQWVDAGLALAQFTEAMRAIDDVIETNAMNLAREQMTSFERDMSSLAEDFQDLRDEAEALGATTEQLAILDGQYAEARQRMADQFREEINTILSDNSFALQRESMTEYQLAVHDLNNRFDEMRDKLIDLGATSSDLTILEQQRAETMEQLVAQLRKQLDDFMISQDPTMGFLKLVNDLETARKQAVALGASEAQLTRLRKIAELEMARFIADLRRSIASSIEGLSEYLGLSGQIEGNYESARDMAEDLYELERRRYEMAQKAIENITKYLKDLETGDLAPGDWRSRLGAGRSNFDEMLELARGGDETALNEITRYADTLLKLGRETLGDTQAYSNLYDYVTGSLRDLMADLALIPAPPEAPTGGDSSASGSVSGSTTGGMSDLEAYWAILELATQIGSLSVATGESVYTLLEEFGIPLLTLTQGMGVSLSNLDMEGLNSLSLLATAFNTNLPEMLNELKVNPNRVAELLGINLEEVRLGIMGGFDGLAEYLGVTIPEALNYVGISVAELAPAFGLYIDNLSEGTLTNLGLMAEALGILPTDLAELLGVPLADIATSFGYELGLSSEENFKALRTLASSLSMSLFDLGQAIGEDFDVIVGGLNADLSSVFSELPEGIGPEVKENLEDLLNNVANAADPKEVQNAVGNLLAFTRDNLPGGIATSLADTLTGLGLGVAEDYGLTDIYSRLGEVRAATRDVEWALSNTINGTLSSGFGSLSSLLTEIRNSLVGEELIEEVPEIAGWGGEGESIARIPTETPGDQYMEAKALEADQDDGMEDLYTRLEESQAQVAELTEKLTEATESLNKLQVDANQRLGKIVGNTRQTAKRTRETKKA